MSTSEFSAQELFLRVDGGLGNRILPTLSALFIGHKLAIPVYCKWAITKGCRCPVEQLFEPRIPWLDFTARYLEYRPDRPHTERAFEQALYTESSLKLRSTGYFAAFHRLYPGEAEAWIAANFDRFFVPQPDLQQAISNFASAQPLAEAIGVHVRRGDKVGRVRNLPPLEAYFAALDANPASAAGIFLATDDGLTAEDSPVARAFRRRYGKRSWLRTKCSVGRDIGGVRDGLIDLWLLRACRQIIGTRCSTFSEVAAIARKALLL